MNELTCHNGWVLRRSALSGRANVYGVDWDHSLALMASGPWPDCVRAAGLRHHDDLPADVREGHIRRAVGA